MWAHALFCPFELFNPLPDSHKNYCEFYAVGTINSATIYFPLFLLQDAFIAKFSG
jgi:hypothetical protein